MERRSQRGIAVKVLALRPMAPGIACNNNQVAKARLTETLRKDFPKGPPLKGVLSCIAPEQEQFLSVLHCTAHCMP